MVQNKLPVPPGIVMRVTQVAADPSTGAADLAKIIEQDPVLSAQILKAVNSAFYAPRSRVKNVKRAVSFMGSNAVRNLVLCLAVRELFPDRDDYPLEKFWESSLQRAAAARCLARRKGLPNVEEVFTQALCQDLGVLLHIQQNPKVAARLANALDRPAAERLKIEEYTDGKRHDDLAYELFQEWKFPEEIFLPVRYHHRPGAAPRQYADRAKISMAAETIADLMMVEDKQGSMHMVQFQLRSAGMGTVQLKPLLDEIGRLVVDAAEMLGIKVSELPTYEEIAALASQGLATLNLSYQEMTSRLERSLEEQTEMAQELDKVNKDLEERASTDGLTGLSNRRAFDESLERELAQSQRQNKPLSLIILDVDHFKRFNDDFGHQAGDLVLKQLGGTLTASVRKSDLPARYGGEEFAVVMPFTNQAQAIGVAERVRSNVEQMRVPWEGQMLKVTVSLGCTTVLGSRSDISPEATIKAADAALYEAKENGRNQVVLG